MGCCSLRVEHINLHPENEGQEYVVEFDFLGKDSIRYYNKVPVEKRVGVFKMFILLMSVSLLLVFTFFFSLQVFKNLQLFMENKEPDDDLFDRLNVSPL